ncbi:CLUMA_CG003651, isoform A [Clunio marinus]|uniref:CLUMA_CG003651, isoform A n=1 Tax=Clunio marinus TaxID=568069 RepID=A0A1J1HPE1_9DIPT|nr:CLUMA_CG003651, isoform A [Clunio marinus]
MLDMICLLEIFQPKIRKKEDFWEFILQTFREKSFSEIWWHPPVRSMQIFCWSRFFLELLSQIQHQMHYA